MKTIQRVDKFLTHFSHPASWMALAILCLALDYLTGPVILFPVLFIFPVTFAAWHRGWRWAIPFAGVLPLARLGMIFIWETHGPFLTALINMLIDMAVFSVFALLTEQVSCQHRELEKEVKILEGLLPICSFCKKIRDTNNQWQPLESYISARSDATFSHGLCPECAKKHYPEYFREKKPA